MTFPRSKLLIAAAFGAVALSACANHGYSDDADQMTATTEQPNIVALAASQDNLSTLVAAVKAADLVDTLSGSGPFTVFAPDNAAFEKLPAGTIDTLLLPSNKATLQSVLTYHVVAGEVRAEDLVALITSNGGTAMVSTVNGGKLSARVENGNVLLTDAKGNTSTVTSTNIDASNGVVHLIDTVVMP